MKHLSLQWRITLMTVLLIGATCVIMNLLLCSSGVYYMDTIADSLQGGSTVILNEGEAASFDPQLIAPDEELTIVIDGAQGRFRTTNWYITAAVTLLSGILTYFVSGRALKPLRSFASQVEQVQLNNLADMRIDEDVIPEFQQLSRSFNQMLERLNNAFAAQRQFTGNAAHELRTPLTNIKSYTETLMDAAGELPADTEKRFLGVISSEADRMTRIVKDLLTLSKLDYGRMDLTFSRFSMKDMLETVYTAMKLDAKNNGHTLSLVFQGEMPEMMGDRERLEQVVVNIISNAIKYTPSGGHIDMLASRRDERHVMLRIQDDGIGIPENDVPRLFERFYRVDKARSREKGGTGLGLAIAKEMVEAHHGTIHLESTLDVGTTVTIVLPTDLHIEDA